MKKALQISIAKTLFTIEEDAFIALENYLTSIKKHFNSTEGKDEIITDIESRIAEQLLETKEKVISLPTVEKVIAIMGQVTDFDDGEKVSADTEPKNSNQTRGKKLYRNPDDIYIGGVASGIAEYFGLNATALRIAFVLLALFNGFGALLYIILWIVLPEAKTKAQKLEMKGDPVTLDTLSQSSTERTEKRDPESSFKKVISFPFKLIGSIIRFVVPILNPLIRIGAGVFLTLVAICTLVGVMILSGFLISDLTWISNDIPFDLLFPGSIYLLTLAGLAFSIVIPVLFVLFGGIAILYRRTFINISLILGLLGVWFIALIISGFGVSQSFNNYQQFIKTSPAFEQVQSEIELNGSFDKVSIQDGMRVNIAKSTTTSLTAIGRVKDVERVAVKIENGVLLISRIHTDKEQYCLFCWFEAPELTLHIPVITDINVRDISRVTSSTLPTNEFLNINLESGAYMNADVKIGTMNATLSDVSLLELRGTATDITIQARNGSRVLGRNLKATHATTTAERFSRIEIEAEETLNATARNGSAIIYYGNPTVIKDISRESRIESLEN